MGISGILGWGYAHSTLLSLSSVGMRFCQQEAGCEDLTLKRAQLFGVAGVVAQWHFLWMWISEVHGRASGSAYIADCSTVWGTRIPG